MSYRDEALAPTGHLVGVEAIKGAFEGACAEVDKLRAALASLKADDQLVREDLLVTRKNAEAIAAALQSAKEDAERARGENYVAGSVEDWQKAQDERDWTAFLEWQKQELSLSESAHDAWHAALAYERKRLQ